MVAWGWGNKGRGMTDNGYRTSFEIMKMLGNYILVMVVQLCVIAESYAFSFFFSFIFISWRLITLQYCSGFCHTLTWISHGFTCIPHPDPPSHLPLHPIPLGLLSAPGPSTCLMHPAWAHTLFQRVNFMMWVISIFISKDYTLIF